MDSANGSILSTDTLSLKIRKSQTVDKSSTYLRWRVGVNGRPEALGGGVDPPALLARTPTRRYPNAARIFVLLALACFYRMRSPGKSLLYHPISAFYARKSLISDNAVRIRCARAIIAIVCADNPDGSSSFGLSFEGEGP